MKSHLKFFASILLMVLCFTGTCCAQTKIDWKQIKNIPDTLEFKNVLLEHLLFKSAYQPVMESVHQGAIYYDNQLEKLRVYENGQWRDLSVTIASDSIGAPLTILGYLQASDIYASQSAYIGKDVNAKGNINGSGTTRLNSLIVNNTLKIPTVASKTLGVGSIYYDTVNKQLKILNNSNQWEPISIDVDPVLSATSTNPVQNKVIYTKFDNFNASVTQELEQTLLDAYNYANGIATQAYNYADTAANNASSSAYNAAVSYANTQILVIDGRINTLNTNLLASLTQGLNGANASATLYASSAVTISEGYAQGLATATYNAAASYTDALRTYVDTQDNLTIASCSKLFVSDIATGTASGTFSFTKNSTTTAVKIKGLGDAAFTNVASISSSIGGNIPSSSTPPSNPTVGQIYFDTTNGVLKYWDGHQWVTVCSSTGGQFPTFAGIPDDMITNPLRRYNQRTFIYPGSHMVDLAGLNNLFSGLGAKYQYYDSANQTYIDITWSLESVGNLSYNSNRSYYNLSKTNTLFFYDRTINNSEIFETKRGHLYYTVQQTGPQYGPNGEVLVTFEDWVSTGRIYLYTNMLGDSTTQTMNALLCAENTKKGLSGVQHSGIFNAYGNTGHEATAYIYDTTYGYNILVGFGSASNGWASPFTTFIKMHTYKLDSWVSWNVQGWEFCSYND